MKARAEQIAELDGAELYGRVVGVRGLMVEVAGRLHAMVGARVLIEVGQGRSVSCEVVGFSGAHALLLPFAPLEGGAARLPRNCHRGAGSGATLGRLAGTGAQCHG